MNFMHKVLNESLKNPDDLITELRDELQQNKLKIVENPEQLQFKTSKTGLVKIVDKNKFYYLNSLPQILSDRDVFRKPSSISEIKIDLSNTITPENYKELYSNIKPRYCFTFSTCIAPYTKASMKYPHYYTIMFDKLSQCEKYHSWFNKCFKTIQEQEAEDEALKEKEKIFEKMLDAEMACAEIKQAKAKEKKNEFFSFK